MARGETQIGGADLNDALGPVSRRRDRLGEFSAKLREPVGGNCGKQRFAARIMAIGGGMRDACAARDRTQRERSQPLLFQNRTRCFAQTRRKLSMMIGPCRLLLGDHR